METRTGKTKSNSDIVPPSKYNQSLPIASKKYHGLIKLCVDGVIPSNFHAFYCALTHGENDPPTEQMRTTGVNLMMT